MRTRRTDRPTWLLDGNVLAALVLAGHEHHGRAHRWFERQGGWFATCVVTQGTLLRVHMAFASDPSPRAAWKALSAVVGHPDHVYWDDGTSYLEVPHGTLRGPKQITDAWLAALARRRGGWLATMDAALAALEPDVVRLLPMALA